MVSPVANRQRAKAVVITGIGTVTPLGLKAGQPKRMPNMIVRFVRDLQELALSRP